MDPICDNCRVPGIVQAGGGVVPTTVRCGNCGASSIYCPTIWEILTEDAQAGEWYLNPLFRTDIFPGEPPKRRPAKPQPPAPDVRLVWLNRQKTRTILRLFRSRFTWYGRYGSPNSLEPHVAYGTRHLSHDDRDFVFERAELKAVLATRENVPKFKGARTQSQYRRERAKRRHGMAKSKDR